MRWCHGVVAVVVTTVALVKGIINSSILGPYRLECNEIGNCDGESDGFKIVIAHNQDHNSSGQSGCSGTIRLSQGLNDQTSGSYTLEMMADDNWRVLISDNYTEGCTAALQTLPELLSLLQQPASCPVTSGTFNFNQSKIMDSTLSQFPKLLFGRLRLTVKIHDLDGAQSARGCVYFDINVVPEDSFH